MKTDRLYDGLPTPFVPVDTKNQPVPAYMWVLLKEFSSTKDPKKFSFPTMLLACSLFDVFSVRHGAIRYKGSALNTTKRFLSLDPSFPDSKFIKAYDPILPFKAEEVKDLNSWPVFLLSSTTKDLVKDFVVNHLWEATCSRFDMVKPSELSSIAAKFLLEGTYWLSEPGMSGQANDWELLADTLDDGEIHGAESLGRFPAWVYVAILHKKNLLSDNLFYHLICHVFLLEMVLSKAVTWKCNQWQYFRKDHSIDRNAWLSEEFAWDFWKDDSVVTWLSNFDAIDFNPTLPATDVKKRVAEKLYSYALTHIGPEKRKDRVFGGTSFLNPEAEAWYKQVSKGEGWGVESNEVQLALSAALQSRIVFVRVREIKENIDLNVHVDPQMNCCKGSRFKNKKFEDTLKDLEKLRAEHAVLYAELQKVFRDQAKGRNKTYGL